MTTILHRCRGQLFLTMLDLMNFLGSDNGSAQNKKKRLNFARARLLLIDVSLENFYLTNNNNKKNNKKITTVDKSKQ